MNDRDIVILFGAGASYGAGHVLPQATPLGPDLYDALAVHYPREWGSESHLGKMWGTQFRTDFERTLSEQVVPQVSSLTLLEWHRRVAEFFALPTQDLEGRLRIRFSSYKPTFFPVLGLYSPDKPFMVAPGKLQDLRN